MKIFISYPREHSEFTDKLAGALIRHGFQVQVDRHDLSALDNWERQLRRMIRGSDTVLFVLSPEWLNSKMCLWELAEAQKHGKRLAPVLHRRLEGRTAPKELAAIQFVTFAPPADFEPSINALVKALNTDADWSRAHTRYQDLAERWDELQRPDSHCLADQELKDAIAWLGARRKRVGTVTDVQRDFVDRSAWINGWELQTLRNLSAWLSTAIGEKKQALTMAALVGLALLVVSTLGMLRWLSGPFLRLIYRHQERATAALGWIILSVFSWGAYQLMPSTEQMARAIGFPPKQEDTWPAAIAQFRTGMKVKGIVGREVKTGRLIDLGNGVRGHVDNLIIKAHPGRIGVQGDMVEIRVLVVDQAKPPVWDRDKASVSLGLF